MSEIPTNWSRWAITILKDFSIRGYVIYKEKLKNGTFLKEEYYVYI